MKVDGFSSTSRRIFFSREGLDKPPVNMFKAKALVTKRHGRLKPALKQSQDSTLGKQL